MTDPRTAPPPRFFADRCLGRTTVELLRVAGRDINRISDVFADDAQDVDDEEWIHAGGERGWALLTKDKKIRYQPALNAATTPVFALADGGWASRRWPTASMRPANAIWRAATVHERQFWVVYQHGRIERRA